METMLFMIHLLRNLLKWFSLFITFLIASLAAHRHRLALLSGFPIYSSLLWLTYGCQVLST